MKLANRVSNGVTIIAIIVTPLLTLFANFMGLVGGWVVYISLGFPTIVYINQIKSAVTLTDLWGGLFKAGVFGLLVAGIGCFRENNQCLRPIIRTHPL